MERVVGSGEGERSMGEETIVVVTVLLLLVGVASEDGVMRSMLLL